ncbi:UTP--glucose-1-phosphate uridylyltransferase [Sporolactobacillus shoreae]|uniref:UTP--glucose-1-phosphate uridylyltransferase n=1 Tax=Sporolactobacillus shoreae TaxID=1465501 RepID=A0A4Z0GNJ6_9BACL|nr:UTP--glucose-1-phosphate uridylyltransferase [Sporolactobacillus shoreae]TGA98710.1 UTP--glucose-1-phosphate uridylyltransferase [Sporolactobacillus shoreae]
MVRKAIIPAAGYGTRGLPITKVLPKEMLPICGRPAIEYIVQEAIDSGIEQILIVVSKNKDMILDYFDRSLELEAYLEKKNKTDLLKKLDQPKVHIQYIRQPYPAGLGDAVRLGKFFVGQEPFAVLLPDEIVVSKDKTALRQLIEKHSTLKGNVLGLKRVDPSELKSYGVVDPQKLDDRTFKLKNIIEKAQHSFPSNLAVVGRYVLEPAIFNYLDRQKPGVGSEIQLTDAIKEMLSDGPGYGIEISGQRFDISKMPEYVSLINLLCSSAPG